MPKKIAIIGLGWLGLPLAKSFAADGYDVIGSTTRTEKLMRLLQSNLSVRIIKVAKNKLEGDWMNFIKDADLLVINLPPDRQARDKTSYPQQIHQIVSRCEPSLKVIFISSSSVYPTSNLIVDEDTKIEAPTASNSALLDAENKVRTYFKGNATIIRFSGLIGEGRHPGKFTQYAQTMSNPTGKINLIRLQDCIALIRRVYDQQYFGEMVNGCGDEHPTRKEYYSKAAESLGLKTPIFNEQAGELWKIVSNEKSKKDLGMKYSSTWEEI